MDYEKKYKDALERARALSERKVKPVPGTTVYECIFPELKKSRDEEILDALIVFYKIGANNNEHTNGIPDKEILAWLEKQGEQKPANNIKPKFEAGDWVVCEVTGSVYQIKDVSETSKYYLTNGDYIVGDEVNHYHRWTIEEAKDGDVLVSGFVIFVFNNIHEDKLNCKCAVHKDGSVMTEPYDLMKRIFFSEVSPSTKEQRDTLFAKMKEAGYEWDAEEKEFIKLTEPR